MESTAAEAATMQSNSDSTNSAIVGKMPITCSCQNACHGWRYYVISACYKKVTPK